MNSEIQLENNHDPGPVRPADRAAAATADAAHVEWIRAQWAEHLDTSATAAFVAAIEALHKIS